jgi:hypothetical protein
MNKENAHLYLPLVQALADGKTIQHSPYDGRWDDVEILSFCSEPKYYRIKPEPRMFEAFVTPDRTLWPLHMTPLINWERITVQEVLE